MIERRALSACGIARLTHCLFHRIGGTFAFLNTGCQSLADFYICLRERVLAGMQPSTMKISEDTPSGQHP
jgi:hypothetical protein